MALADAMHMLRHSLQNNAWGILDCINGLRVQQTYNASHLRERMHYRVHARVQ